MNLDLTDRLQHWAALRDSNDADVSLLDGALLIAADEYPGLDQHVCRQQIAELAGTIAARMDDLSEPLERLRVLNRLVFQEFGFQGNESDYYDPRNSYLNEVLDRRLGNPISLAILHIELGRRMGLGLEGVSFPGHFLVRFPTEDGLLVLDPYNRGRSLSLDELRERAAGHFQNGPISDEQMTRLLEPSDARSILGRVLRNLKQLYYERQDYERALRCADRLITLNDDRDTLERRDRGNLYQLVGHAEAAIADWRTYLERQPQGEDADSVRQSIIAAAGPKRRLH